MIIFFIVLGIIVVGSIFSSADI